MQIKCIVCKSRQSPLHYSLPRAKFFMANGMFKRAFLLFGGESNISYCQSNKHRDADQIFLEKKISSMKGRKGRMDHQIEVEID